MRLRKSLYFLKRTDQWQLMKFQGRSTTWRERKKIKNKNKSHRLSEQAAETLILKTDQCKWRWALSSSTSMGLITVIRHILQETKKSAKRWGIGKFSKKVIFNDLLFVEEKKHTPPTIFVRGWDSTDTRPKDRNKNILWYIVLVDRWSCTLSLCEGSKCRTARLETTQGQSVVEIHTGT